MCQCLYVLSGQLITTLPIKEICYLANDVRQKVVETQGKFLVCYSTPEKITRFRENPTTIAIDGTHKTCGAGYHLVTVLVFGGLLILELNFILLQNLSRLNLFFLDSLGEGTLVCQCLMESENKALCSIALNELKSLAPEACSAVECILSDINAWREIISVDVIWSDCHWHLEKSCRSILKTRKCTVK